MRGNPVSRTVHRGEASHLSPLVSTTTDSAGAPTAIISSRIASNCNQIYTVALLDAILHICGLQSCKAIIMLLNQYALQTYVLVERGGGGVYGSKLNVI